MNRRNFLGSLIAAVPALALVRGAQTAPAPEKPPTANLGDWMKADTVTANGPLTHDEIAGLMDEMEQSNKDGFRMGFRVTQRIGYYGRGTT